MMMEKPKEPLLAYCSSCWCDRIITTNCKCKVCGTDISKRHWKISIKKLEALIKTGDMPLEIKGKTYLIPKKMISDFSSIENYIEKIMFIEEVKKNCKVFRL